MRVTIYSLPQGREQLGGQMTLTTLLPTIHQQRTCALGAGMAARPMDDMPGSAFHAATCAEFQQLLGLH